MQNPRESAKNSSHILKTLQFQLSMSKHSLTSRALLRGIALAAVVLSIFIIARVLLVYMPPLVFSVSPKVFTPGEVVVVRGIMGGKSKRDATQLFLNGVPVTDQSVEKRGFFSMRVRFTKASIDNIVENRGGLIALVYKKYRSGETIISLANGAPKTLGSNAASRRGSAADDGVSITLRSSGALYPDEALAFEVTFARSEGARELSAASNLGYFFEIQPRRGEAYVVLPSQQMLRVVGGRTFIFFPVPVSLFPRPPYEEERAAVRVFRGGKQAVAEYSIALAMRAVLSSPPAIFAVNASYNIGAINGPAANPAANAGANAGGGARGNTADANDPPTAESRTMMTALIPPERPWQLVSAENSDGTAPVQFDAVRGIIRAESPLKVTFVLTRYPFMDIEWNTIDAAFERRYFANVLRHDDAASQAAALSAQNTADLAFPSLPVYFADAQYYIGNVERALGVPAPRVSPPAAGTLQNLIAYYSTRARQMVQQSVKDDDAAAGENSATAAGKQTATNLPTDAGTRTILFAEEVLQNFVGTQDFAGAATLRTQLMELILIAANLRENGIPAQVMLGFAHESEANKLLPAYPAVWLEVFTSRYGIIPLVFQNEALAAAEDGANAADAAAGEAAAKPAANTSAKNASDNKSMIIPDSSHIGLAVFEQLRFLDYLRQNPAFLSDISSIKLQQ